MTALDLQLGVTAAALGLAFVGSPLIDRFLKGPRGAAADDGQTRQTWWLFFLAVWFVSDAIVALAVGVNDDALGFQYWPAAFLVGGLVVLVASIASSLRPNGPAGSPVTGAE